MAAAPGRRGRVSWPIALAAALVVAAVLTAWVLQGRYADEAGSSKDAPVSSYSISVRKDGATLKTYDLAALHALPQTRIVIDGKEQTGPLAHRAARGRRRRELRLSRRPRGRPPRRDDH